jgi:hypothetical protein
MKEGLERKLAHPAVVAAVVTGVATSIAAVAAGLITSRTSEEQLEGNLIVEAVKFCDKNQALKNLKFLLAAGFLPVIPIGFRRLSRTVSKN